MALLEEDELDRHDCFGNWSWSEFEGREEYINEDIVFRGGEEGGISAEANRTKSELACFRLFFTNPVVDKIVKETNVYARQERAKEGGSNESWTPVTREDINAFIGVAIAMGIIEKDNLAEYWTTCEILDTPWFRDVMPGRRFASILRYLHLNNDHEAARTADLNLSDKLYKVRPLLDSLSESVPRHYRPGRELSIDEQMIGSKARSSDYQSVKGRPKKHEVKLWALCDAKVHYCLGFQICTGAGSGEQGLSFRVVNELMSPYLGVGHHLYIDDFYTSPELLAHLLSHDTLAVGTVRQDRVNMPMRLRTSCQNVEVGQCLFLRSHRMTACRWKDKRDVFCLSTVHGNTLQKITRGHGEEEKVQRPVAICDYNTFMGGVEVYDQLLTYYQIARRYKCRWKKIFWRLIDVMILNAYALWKLKHDKSSDYTHKHFRLALSEQLTAALMERDVPRPSKRPLANRLDHVGDPRDYETRKWCTVCNSESKTTVGCNQCGEEVRLHLGSDDGRVSCFALYHSKAVL